MTGAQEEGETDSDSDEDSDGSGSSGDESETAAAAVATQLSSAAAAAAPRAEQREPVRVMVCSEKKDGVPNVGDSKLVVLQRSAPLGEAMAKAQGKLRIKKKPKALGLVQEGVVVQWLNDLSLVRDDDTLCLSSLGAGKAKTVAPRAAPPPPPPPADELQQQQQQQQQGDGDAQTLEGTGSGEASIHAEVSNAAIDRLKASYQKLSISRQGQKAAVSAEQVAALSRQLSQAAASREGSARHQQMMQQRQSLPVYNFREELLELIDENQVVVVEGETGTVGYRIRLESRASAATRLTFCTTGVLLRRLTTDGGLDGITHVLVDEVHERGLETDFLLIILKDLLPRRPDLKVVLMSATLQASLFTDYFGDCPCLKVPGRTFPVTTLHLEDIGKAIGRPMGGRSGNFNGSARGGRGGRGPQGAGRGSGRGPGAPPRDDGTEGAVVFDPITGQQLSGAEARAAGGSQAPLVSPQCQDKLDLDEIAELVAHIVDCESRGTDVTGRSGAKGGKPRAAWGGEGGGAAGGGAILVFMPGTLEINRLVSMLRQDRRLSNCCEAFALHSALSPDQQRAVFQVMPPGRRKVVVSTNIAETSITIEDCTHFHATAMPEHTLPEMLRCPLEELVLQTLILEIGDPASVLARAVQPPPEKMLHAALRNLYELEAVQVAPDTLETSLTPLGYHLAHLPMDARVGKLLIMGALLRCLDPVLTVAAALSSKTPFVRPMGSAAEAAATDVRKRFAGGNCSDSLAVVAAYKAWDAECRRVNSSSGTCPRMKMWCRDNFINSNAMALMAGLREQFREHLVAAGFASVDRAADSAHAGNVRLLQSVLCAGLYPQVAWFVRPKANGSAGESRWRVVGGSAAVGTQRAHFALRDDPEAAFVHPGSINAERYRGQAEASGRQPQYVLYHSRVKTRQVYLHETTCCTAFSLLLWGSHIRHLRHTEDTGGPTLKKRALIVAVDEWLRFKTTESIGVVFKHLRKDINELLLSRIESARAAHTDGAKFAGVLADVVVRLLDMEASHSMTVR
ncbi:P-loop containing nucleoside triphosphate hydrolase protein [Tribonema minus]|uniref:P-loop containing nucleoside triphosphate hydrolase protein n=1 Tax=Tribonema minus TaxID=303371 RepID=A0A835Z4K1_9STRA|nr:P-loop containing nucleoside triphosphate hydrolase protein [Tribonema minus]